MGVIRIKRFDSSPSGGHWLSFASEDEVTFYRIISEIKSLGYDLARWDRVERAWWLASPGLARLAGRDIELSEALGAYLRGEQGAQQDECRRRRGKRGSAKTAGAPGGPPANVAQALATLYVTPDAPVIVVGAAYRALARSAHPDAGGSHDAMKAINLAYELADAWAKEHTLQAG